MLLLLSFESQQRYSKGVPEPAALRTSSFISMIQKILFVFNWQPGIIKARSATHCLKKLSLIGVSHSLHGLPQPGLTGNTYFLWLPGHVGARVPSKHPGGKGEIEMSLRLCALNPASPNPSKEGNTAFNPFSDPLRGE